MFGIATEVTASPNTKDAIADRLAAARRRTLALIEPLDDEQLNRVHSPLLSPLAWDLGHIANFEELWLVQTVGGREPLHGDLGRFYDAIENPRRNRGELPILRDAELRAYLAEVRERTLEVLDEVEIGADAPDRLLREGFVYELLIAHELQHEETMLQLLAMVDGYELPDGIVDERRGPTPGASGEALQGRGSGTLHGGDETIAFDGGAEMPPATQGSAQMPPATHGGAQMPPSTHGGAEMLAIDGGEYAVGAPAAGFAYDNERPRHMVTLAPFEIDRTPVTNGAYIAYMEETGAEPPLYWERDGEGSWVHTAMGRRDPIDPAAPVIHVSWHEADAFARRAGKRLPTEFEWEAAFAGSGASTGLAGTWDDPSGPTGARDDPTGLAGARNDSAGLAGTLDDPTGPAGARDDPTGLAGARSDSAGLAGTLDDPTGPAGARDDPSGPTGPAAPLVGQVWEWTSSEFRAYPGFEAFPYREYSEVFFGDKHKVLRGGSWATAREVMRPSFRNWDLPQRRQIFAGFRCARSTDHRQPDHRQPDHRQPDHRQPDHRQPDHRQPDHRQPDHRQPDHRQPDHRQPDHRQPDHRQPDHRQPDHRQPDHRQPDHRQPDHRQPDHRQPDHRQPDHRQPDHRRLDDRQGGR